LCQFGDGDSSPDRNDLSANAPERRKQCLSAVER
jgi:hypothetical protein